MFILSWSIELRQYFHYLLFAIINLNTWNNTVTKTLLRKHQSHFYSAAGYFNRVRITTYDSVFCFSWDSYECHKNEIHHCQVWNIRLNAWDKTNTQGGSSYSHTKYRELLQLFGRLNLCRFITSLHKIETIFHKKKWVVLAGKDVIIIRRQMYVRHSPNIFKFCSMLRSISHLQEGVYIMM